MTPRIVSVPPIAVAVVSLTTVAKPEVKSGRSGRHEQEADSWKNEKKNMKTAHKTCKLRPQIDEMKNEGAGERDRERGRVRGGTRETGSTGSSKSKRKPTTNPAASVARMWSHRIASYHRYHKNVQLATVAADAAVACCPVSIERAATKNLTVNASNQQRVATLKIPQHCLPPCRDSLLSLCLFPPVNCSFGACMFMFMSVLDCPTFGLTSCSTRPFATPSKQHQSVVCTSITG